MCFFFIPQLTIINGLSKLQKLDPSAIDKCAMVFVPLMAIEKEEIETFFKHHCAIYKRSQHSQRLLPVKNERMIDDNKKIFNPHLAIENDFFPSAFVNPCMM
jgi:hypothetical protein